MWVWPGRKVIFTKYQSVKVTSKTFSINVFDDFLKVCYITFEINLLAMPWGPTRGLSSAIKVW